MAAEKISKVDLKRREAWETGNEFSLQWKKQLSLTPGKVHETVSSNKQSGEEKIKALVDLGVPAIPFILDEMDEGNKELIPAVQIILDEDHVNQMASHDEVEWLKGKKDEFQELKAYVFTKIKHPQR